MWLQKPAAAAQRKGPYTNICSFRGLRRQYRGRDRTRPYVALETRTGSSGEGPYTTICGFRDSTEEGTIYMALETPRQQHWKSDRKHTYIIDHICSYLSNRQRAVVQKFGVALAGVKCRVSTFPERPCVWTDIFVSWVC